MVPRGPVLVAAALLAAAPANAGTIAWPESCNVAVGIAAGTGFPQEDWDFTTPDDPRTASPVFSQECVYTEYRYDAFTGWQGLDIIPLYQHGYRALRVRAPLLTQGYFGAQFKVGEGGHFGPYVVTNNLAIGFGARMDFVPIGSDRWIRKGLQLRAHYLWGVDPEVQAQVLYTFGTRDASRDDSVYIDRKTMTMKRVWRYGFEIGSMQGLIAETWKKHWHLHPYARAGVLTFLPTGTALQPTVIVGLEDKIADPKFQAMNRTWHNGWRLGAGVSVRDGKPVPIGQASLFVDCIDESAIITYGVIAGPGFWSLDVGWGWML